MNPAERPLVWFLRASAVIFWTAAPFVVLPTTWIRQLATWIGLELPDLPLLEYLMRSVSGVSTVLGVVLWFMARDVRRYVPLLRVGTIAALVFDAAMIGIDILIPMPLMWTIGEAIGLTAWAVGLLWLAQRVNSNNRRTESSQEFRS